MRLGIVLGVCLAVGCGGTNKTPASTRCSVLNSAVQVESCVGKTVTIRGKVVGQPRPSIIGVDVDASPDLFEKWGHAVGTIEKTGASYALKQDGALSKVSATKQPGS